MIFKICFYFPFSLYHGASLAQRFVLSDILACSPKLVGPQKQKQTTPLREGSFIPCTGYFGEKASGRRRSENPFTLAPEAGPEQMFPCGSCLTLHPARGSDRQTLHINPLCSGHFWVHPSSNLRHRLGVQVNSRGRKKRVWSYPFPFLLCPSLPKNMYPSMAHISRLFFSFEWFSYSETAPLNFA